MRDIDEAKRTYLILLQPLVDAVAMEQVHVAARKSPQSIAGSEIAQAHRAVRVRRYPLRTVLEMGYALNDVLRRAARNRGLRIRHVEARRKGVVEADQRDQ